MHQFTFGPIQPFEIGCVQQMIQGTDLTSMPFNRTATPIFMARHKSDIAGFVFGQCGYGDNAHILTIHGTYLCGQFNDEAHEHELHLAFINWAHEKLNVTHYKLHEFDEPKPIGISHYIPPQNVTIPAVEEVSEPTVSVPQYYEELAHH